ncbi:Porphobilinogen deaminase [Lamellibrachia satsuma]|nr:Porphobilinogen deaminase [Lamellibrachia satsuma]
MTEPKKVIKVGSRKSELALIQTRSVIAHLKSLFPDIDYELITMTTMGDNILDTALSKIGEKSLFTKELEKALLDNTVDFVVHSLKDLPTVLPEGMVIGAICKRDDPRDALVLHPCLANNNHTLATLPKNSVIGTSSLRRAAQLKRNFPSLRFKDIRGNLNTRLRKLDKSNDYDGLILAVAGMERMGWQDRISQVSQGAMAVECRGSDPEILELLSHLHDYDTLLGIIAERAFLRELEGGCSVPVACRSEVDNDQLLLKGGVYSIDGTKAVVDTMTTKLPAEWEPSTKKSTKRTKQFSCVVAENFCQEALQKAEDLGVKLAKTMVTSGSRGDSMGSQEGDGS